jgi:hypothetical protein
MLMFTTSDPAAQIRLRELVLKYKVLADRAKKEVQLPLFSKTAA